MDKKEIIICKAIIYLLANNKTEYNYTYNNLKYLIILYTRKYNELSTEQIELNNDNFKLILYKLKSLNMINISDEVMMNRFVSTKVRFKNENYSLEELALLDIIIDDYSYRSVIDLYDLVYGERR